MSVCTIGSRSLESCSDFASSHIELEPGGVTALLQNADPESLRGKKVLYIGVPNSILQKTQDILDEHSSTLISGIGANFYTQRDPLPAQMDCILIPGLKSCDPTRFFLLLSRVCSAGGRVIIGSSNSSFCRDDTIRTHARHYFSHIRCNFGDEKEPSVMVLENGIHF